MPVRKYYSARRRHLPLDRTEQCCGVSLPTLNDQRIGRWPPPDNRRATNPNTASSPITIACSVPPTRWPASLASPAPRSTRARSTRSPTRCPTRPTRKPACSDCATASASTGRPRQRRRWRSSTTWRRCSMPPGRACAMPASERPDWRIACGNCENCPNRCPSVPPVRSLRLDAGDLHVLLPLGALLAVLRGALLA